MEGVLISVIIPVYNMQDTLSETLESVLEQTLEDIEVICINDGSTDGSADILKEFSDKDERVKVISQSNKGPATARNAGIETASGIYVCFLDSDDYYPERNTLEVLYTTAIANNVNICGGSFSELNNGKLETKWDGIKSKYTFEQDGLTFYKNYQFDYGYQRFIYDRKFLNSNNIRFPEYRRFQDPPFFVKAMVAADKFYALKRPTYVYRVGGFKRIVWTKEKLLHMLSGLKDLLNLSSEYRLAELHEQTIKRATTTFLSLLVNHADVAQLLEGDLKDFIFSIDKSLVGKEAFSTLGFYKLLAFAGVGARTADFEKEEVCERPEKNTAVVDNLRNAGRLRDCEYKDNAPLVSVIIPVYNVERYISDCISTVIDQTYGNIEILCVDDGSEDRSVSIVKKFQKIDKRIKILHKENGGLSSARNYGMERASGKYIMLLDSDDYVEQDAVSKLVGCAERSSADVVHFNARAFYEREELLESFGHYKTFYDRKKSYAGVYKTGELFYTLNFYNDFKPSAWINFLRTDFIKEKDLFFYDGIIHEDNLFSTKALLLAKTAEYIDDVFYVRRIREDSIVTKDISIENITGYFTCAAELARFKNKTELTDEVSKELDRFIHLLLLISFDCYNKKSSNGLELSEVKAALKTPEYRELFELLTMVKEAGTFEQFERRQYMVKYHQDNKSKASDKRTTVTYGTLTKTMSLFELGFANENKTFAGWRVYREYDDAWFLRDSEGNRVFKQLIDGNLPEGHAFVLYKDAETVKATAPWGEVHFYAQWR